LPLSENQLAKILVSRDQYAGRIPAVAQHRLIGNSGRHFRDISHIMTVLAESFHDLPVDALVGKESHYGASSTG
jgi:hypothetical protein